MSNVIKKIYQYLKFIFYKIANIKCNIKLKKINILNNYDTVNMIISEKKSISRFGDGEFRWILNSNNIPAFQDNSEDLTKRLKEVLSSNDDRILICIPKILKTDEGFKLETRLFWESIKFVYFIKIIPLLKSSVYGNASVSRFYIDYKKYAGSTERINNIKRIWNKRNVLIVEGEDTKFGVNNDLLSNSTSIKRIICPSKNAFAKYNTILSCIKKEAKKDDIILISLGPTATILAYDLAIYGRQAIDIGHLDSEYEWYKRKVKERTAIDGKYNYEVENNSNIKIDSKKYKSEIIKKII